MITLLAFLACRGGVQHEGTIVGNPGDAKSKLAQANGIEFYAATGTIQAVSMSYQGQEQEIELDGDAFEMEEAEIVDVDLLEPEFSFLMPAGTWDSMSIYFSEVFIEGEELSENRGFVFVLEDVDIVLDGQKSFDISEKEYILEVASPDWLSSDLILSIDLEEEEEEIIVDVESEYYVDIWEPLREQTGLFNDDDGDGEVNDTERENGNVAYTTSTAAALDQEDDSQEDEDTGTESQTVSTCGCKDTSMSHVLLPLMLLVLARRKED